MENANEYSANEPNEEESDFQQETKRLWVGRRENSNCHIKETSR